MCIIYLARCRVNGKGYVGKTVDLERRKKGHQGDAYNGDTRVFQRAIRKYGWESFEWTILYQDDDNDRDWMNWWEVKFIREMGTLLPNGYNMTIGGDGGGTFTGRHHSEESLRKMSVSHKASDNKRNTGIPHTEETKQKIRAKAIGREISEETRKKISEAGKGRKGWNQGLPSCNRGKTLDEICGDRAEEVRKKMSQYRKGKTMEEIYGAERAFEINKKQIAARTGRKVTFSAQAIENIREGVRRRDAKRKASLVEGS